MDEYLNDQTEREREQIEFYKQKMEYYNSMSNLYSIIWVLILIALGLGYYFFSIELDNILLIIIFLIILNPGSSIREKVVENFVFMTCSETKTMIYQEIIKDREAGKY